MKIRSLKFLGAFVTLLLLCTAGAVQAAGAHHTLFQEDWSRTPTQLKGELLTCLYGPAIQCRADRHIAVSPKERIERYAREGFGMGVDEFLLALDGATMRDCVGTIRTMFVDDEGNFVFRTRACKVGPNGEPEQIAVLPDGNNLALPCANPNEKEVKAEIPPPPPPPVLVVRRPDCEDGPPVTFQSGGSEDIFGGISAGSSFAGMGIGGTTFNGVVFNGCK